MSSFDPNEMLVDDLALDLAEQSVETVAAMDAATENIDRIEQVGDAFEPSVSERSVPLPVPSQPIALPKRPVSGCYRSCGGMWELELRVDIDGVRPMRRISGDYYSVSGSTTSYFGSFRVEAVTLNVSDGLVVATGIATTTWATTFTKIRVTIPRHSIFMPPAMASVQWFTVDNRKGSSYACIFKSRYFRKVLLEQDRERGVTPFESYNTGDLPSGGPARTLTINRAYEEAGIEVIDGGRANELPVAPGSSWSNAELHAAMVNHFSLWKNSPQWKVWLLHAAMHDIGPRLLGIMFDQHDFQRQGCAVFYSGSLGGTDATHLRSQLYTCVHELGHCFNLYHSFHKKYMNPPRPNRPAAKSWMNYPQNYPGGSSAYWAAFPFAFDQEEVIHLRHAYRHNIIFGGADFGDGAAFVDENIVDDTGLSLRLEVRESFGLGEPVFVDIRLANEEADSKVVNPNIHPNYSFVQIAVRRPSGQVLMYHPPMEHLIDPHLETLDENRPSVFDCAYIGYDHDHGLVFDQPGEYQLRGIYYALDGSAILSDVVSLSVQAPQTESDRAVAELFLGEEQGMLMYLEGSDSSDLASGNEALDRVIEEHASHPLAVYAQFVKGTNAARPFKSLGSDKAITTRDPQPDVAEELLAAVVSASETVGEGVENMVLNRVMGQLAMVQNSAGKVQEARSTLTNMRRTLIARTDRQHVKDLIASQVTALRSKL